MPAAYAVDVQKVLDGEYWTNRYLIDSPNIADAESVAQAIMELERAITKSYVLFDKIRVATYPTSDGEFLIIPVGTFGLVTGASTDYLPLFNVVRVDFGIGTGRPCRKYLKLPLVEGEVSNRLVSGGLIAGVETDYIAPMVALSAVCDPQGNEIVSGTVAPQVAMRQLRRGSKRRATPII